MTVRLGIDLGTTYSSISWYDEYNSRVDTIDLDCADGLKMVRSVVYYPGPQESPVIGEAAWNAMKQFPERVIVGVKRAMGTDYRTEMIDGVDHTAPQVSAEILKALARDAALSLGQDVKDVIITVPAYFGDNERAATEEAGKLAGLNVLGLLPEPHAAALAFAVDKVANIDDKHLLVYDLGGGTFDVTMIHARLGAGTGDGKSLKIETLCKEGNARLGGLDWDRALLEIVAEKALQQFDVDVRQDPKNEVFLLDNCEKAKRFLSRTNSVSIVADMANHAVEVSRSEFEDRTSALLLQTEMLLDQVLDDFARMMWKEERKKAGEPVADTDPIPDADKQRYVALIDVMLTGGSSRMPMVRKLIEAKMGRPPLQHGNPELLVTIGAAYQAHLLEGKAISRPIPDAAGNVNLTPIQVQPGGISDTSFYSVGVEVLRPDSQGQLARFNSILVPKGTPYGRDVVSKDFGVAEDGVTEIYIILYKGESNKTEECEQLATFIITGLPGGRRRGAPVQLALGYDNNGILRGKATDMQSGREVQIAVERGQTACVPA